MVKEAHSAGFLVDEERYSSQLGCDFADELPADRALGAIRRCGCVWWLAGGWVRREIVPGEFVHPSVFHLIEQTDD